MVPDPLDAQGDIQIDAQGATSHLGSAPPSLHTRDVRTLSTVFLLLALCLVGWTVFLGFSLPPSYDARHWNLLWIGFDVAIVAVLTSAAWAAWARRQILASAALIAGTLLLCDAWFDIVTSIGQGDQWVTLLTGFGAELPLALFFFWLHRRLVVAPLLSSALPDRVPAPMEPGQPTRDDRETG